MKIRYYMDPESGEPHIYKHAVSEAEVEDVLRGPGEDRPDMEGSRIAIGRTSNGRYLCHICPRSKATESFCDYCLRAARKAAHSISSSPTEKVKMKRSKFPAGWDEDRVRHILAHYETQTEEEAVAEDEAAFEAAGQTVMEVPKELVPKVRELIANTADIELHRTANSVKPGRNPLLSRWRQMNSRPQAGREPSGS